MKHNLDFMDTINQQLEAQKAAYRILHVPETADMKQIKKAYRAAAVEHHPDHHQNSPQANQEFVRIKCAYEFLLQGTYCDLLFEQNYDSCSNGEESPYRTDNSWGHFLWWKDKFFEPQYLNRKMKKHNSCI